MKHGYRGEGPECDRCREEAKGTPHFEYFGMGLAVLSAVAILVVFARVAGDHPGRAVLLVAVVCLSYAIGRALYPSSSSQEGDR